jgi:hypothetical protein
VGVSASAGYEWLYRGWGAHPDRPPAPVYVAFARAVDAVFPGGFAERHEDEFVEAQSNDETANREAFAEPQNSGQTGDAAGFSEFPESGEGFAEVTQPTKSDTQRDRARVKRTATRNPDTHRWPG